VELRDHFFSLSSYFLISKSLLSLRARHNKKGLLFESRIIKHTLSMRKTLILNLNVYTRRSSNLVIIITLCFCVRCNYTVQQNLGHVLSLGFWLSDFIRWLSKPPKRPFFPLWKFVWGRENFFSEKWAFSMRKGTKRFHSTGTPPTQRFWFATFLVL